MKGIVKNIAVGVGKLGAATLFKLKKASPEICLVGGVACIIGGVVLACKASKETDAVLDEAKERIEDVKASEELSEAEIKRETGKEKLRMVGKLAVKYGPAIAFIASGIILIFTSHGIMKKRNGALLASYNALDAAFKRYRDNVLAEDDGKARDRRYLIGERAKPEPEGESLEGLDEIACDVNKEGMRMANVMNPYGPYTFEFSRFTSARWSAHSLSNLNIIRSAEDWATRQLTLYGHLFLNDVLRYLDIDEVPWGQLVGWIRGDKNGDSYVECLAEEDASNMELDLDMYKKPIFLTFNCDGVIWNRI